MRNSCQRLSRVCDAGITFFHLHPVWEQNANATIIFANMRMGKHKEMMHINIFKNGFTNAFGLVTWTGCVRPSAGKICGDSGPEPLNNSPHAHIMIESRARVNASQRRLQVMRQVTIAHVDKRFGSEQCGAKSKLLRACWACTPTRQYISNVDSNHKTHRHEYGVESLDKSP